MTEKHERPSRRSFLRKMFDLTEGLIRRGYGDDDIRGILGGKFARVLGEIWG
jgi:membrane dipeptidase